MGAVKFQCETKPEGFRIGIILFITCNFVLNANARTRDRGMRCHVDFETRLCIGNSVQDKCGFDEF